MQEDMDLEIYQCIRFDFDLGIGSLIDVIVFMTGKDSNFASGKLRSLQETYPHLPERYVRMQFGGKGVATPFADVQTMIFVASTVTSSDDQTDLRLMCLLWAFDRSVSLHELFPNEVTVDGVFMNQVRDRYFDQRVAI